MAQAGRSFAIGFALLLSGCGTYVPGLEEPLQSPPDGQLLVQAIVNNIDCEVRDSIGDIVRHDVAEVRSGRRKHRQTAWLDGWGVQTTLTLEVNERGGVNPSAQWLPVSPANAVFSLAGGASLSAEATRSNKIVSYYSVADVVNGFRCGENARTRGPFLLQSDLKLKEWLLDVVMLEATGVAQVPPTKEALQHQVTFEVVSAGSLTPSWTLTRVLVNKDGSLFEARRGRKHDLIITLGPVDPALVSVTRAGPRLASRGARASTAASNLHLASEIGVAVSSALRNAR